LTCDPPVGSGIVDAANSFLGSFLLVDLVKKDDYLLTLLFDEAELPPDYVYIGSSSSLPSTDHPDKKE
jgi:hypothetical protein